MINVDFQVEWEGDAIPSHDDISQWAQAALDGLIEEADVSVVLVGPEESQQLNHEFRGKDKPTNVLSFPFEVPEELAELDVDIGHTIGDLIICVPVVEQEAIEQNKPLMHHWAHMVWIRLLEEDFSGMSRLIGWPRKKPIKN